MDRLARVVARNSAFGAGAQIIIKILSFLFTVLIVRNLGAEDFGQYAAVLAFGALFVFFADLGLSPYTVREVARLRDAPDGAAQIAALYGDVLRIRFILSIVTALLLIGTAWITGRPAVMVGAIALGTLGLIMYSLHGTSDSLLAGYERLDISAAARVVYQFCFVGAGALVLWLGLGYYGLIGANLLGIALMTTVCYTGARRLGLRIGAVNRTRWLRLLRASMPFGIIGFTLGLSYKFDTVLLNIFRSDVETGHYAAAYNLIFSMVLISNILNTALFPTLTRQAASDASVLPAVYGRALRYLLVLSLPIAIGGAALAHQIIPFLFGEGYAGGITALRLLIWVLPLMFITEFLGYIVVIAGREARVARAVVLSTSINVVFNIAAVPFFGIAGAAITTVITELILTGQYLWMLRDTLRDLPWVQIAVRPGLAALLMGGVVLLASPWLPLLANIALGGVVYGLLVLGMGILSRDELRFIRSLRQRPPVAREAA
ncbi:MAG: flippase [Oscillochloris sp.]|nr:flippase [Oscillochloris sp.]